MMRFTAVVAVTVMLCSADAHAKRRDGGGGNVAQLEISLKHAVAFGDTTVAPGRYRVSISGDTLILSQARTMVTAAQLKAEPTELSEAVATSSAVVRAGKRTIEIRVRAQDRQYVVRGNKVQHEASRGPAVDLASRKGAFGITGGIPDAKTDLELIEQSLGRYEKDVKHCADQAHKQRWTTDHPRFARCVCPLTTKWRMPKVEKSTRVHRMLAKRRSGYSITVNSDGKVEACRVWIGAAPPADEKKRPSPAEDATAAR